MTVANNHLTLLGQEDTAVDVHAPAKTYYTTGSNAGNAIHRLRTLSVSFYLIEHIYQSFTFTSKGPLHYFQHGYRQYPSSKKKKSFSW
jgi:hypothetical protein